MGTQAPTSGAGADHWTAEAYSASAAFVPRLTQKILHYLDPQPTDRVLDIGCGDGKFTANFVDRVEYVLGLDASKGMIEAAKRDFARGNAEYRTVDCRYLDQELQGGSVASATWDKVDPTTRVAVLQAIHGCLKPNGSFIFEMGGHGNVPEVHAAIIAALVHQGVKIEAARQVMPWFFPSETWMRKTLEGIGFRVERLEMEYRPTKLTTDEKGGIEGWVRLMGASPLEALDEGKREDAVREPIYTSSKNHI
ncbi:conserved hypothetical protein [Uncinocarpus reesii 1704]|uniref:Methyltransferase domain-containing protein n=1 Tax=Uncinocarpus reesii (strain UAMH 1704) TaxID=336963 RepID=C4JZV4_UNCRE|nr:uncharacterized protein UREG_07705 [Uncinocarpus reesii 1704]EEP82840.1 conserved hypothetical protein [Uncinocarpus reesii 1704]